MTIKQLLNQIDSIPDIEFIIKEYFDSDLKWKKKTLVMDALKT
jgi:hypothetical protein